MSLLVFVFALITFSKSREMEREYERVREIRKEVERTATPFEQQRRAKEYVQRGLQFKEAREYEKAVAAFTTALKQDPLLGAEVYHYLGHSFLCLGGFYEARRNLELAAKGDPERSQIYLDLGNTRAALGDWEKAIINYDKAIDLDRVRWPQAWIMKWIGYKREPKNLSKWKNMESGLTQIVELHSGWWRLMWRLIRPEKDMPESERDFFTESPVTNKHPTYRCAVHYFIGVRYKHEGQLESAKASFKKCVEVGEELGVEWIIEYHLAKRELEEMKDTD